jgi:hypothetical protein
MDQLPEISKQTEQIFETILDPNGDKEITSSLLTGGNRFKVVTRAWATEPKELYSEKTAILLEKGKSHATVPSIRLIQELDSGEPGQIKAILVARQGESHSSGYAMYVLRVSGNPKEKRVVFDRYISMPDTNAITGYQKPSSYRLKMDLQDIEISTDTLLTNLCPEGNIDLSPSRTNQDQINTIASGDIPEKIVIPHNQKAVICLPVSASEKGEEEMVDRMNQIEKEILAAVNGNIVQAEYLGPLRNFSTLAYHLSVPPDEQSDKKAAAFVGESSEIETLRKYHQFVYLSHLFLRQIMADERYAFRYQQSRTQDEFHTENELYIGIFNDAYKAYIEGRFVDGIELLNIPLKKIEKGIFSNPQNVTPYHADVALVHKHTNILRYFINRTRKLFLNIQEKANKNAPLEKIDVNRRFTVPTILMPLAKNILDDSKKDIAFNRKVIS